MCFIISAILGRINAERYLIFTHLSDAIRHVFFLFFFFFVKDIFITKSQKPQDLKKMLTESPASNAWRSVFKNASKFLLELFKSYKIC